MTASAAVVQAAHDMLARGYAVVPVRLNKRPLGEGWRRIWPAAELDAAFTRPDIVGVGFLGGPLSHDVVPIDFDTDEAEVWWREQHAAAGLDPDDYPTVLTPRPGKHRYVSDVRGTLSNAAGEMGDLGIDVRGRGQAVLPPSPHPAGGNYTWAPGRSLADFEHVPACPDFVYDAIARITDAPAPEAARAGNNIADVRIYAWCRRALDGEKSRLAGLASGARNTELNTAALKLGALAHYNAFSRSEAHAALEDACLQNGYIQDDGRPAFEATFASGWAAGEASPKTLDLEDRRPAGEPPQTNGKGEGPRAPDREPEAFAPLPYTVVSTLAGILPAPRSWCVRDWIPDHAMTLLAGDGGVGKSILALQLHIACCVGIPWLGLPVDPRPSFYFSAEDPFDEVHRRVFEIAARMDVDIAALDKFAFCSLADEDAVLMAPGDRFPVVLRPTEIWDRLVLAVKAVGARLVTIDTAADTFGGDEIKRREVRAFVSLMNRHSRAINGAMVLTSHPSLDGLRSGSGTSGSTGWNNSTRSRLYLAKPEVEDGAEIDPDARVLTRKKANFARTGDSIAMRWQDGVLVTADDLARLDRAAIAAKAERVFRSLLVSTYAAGSWVSANISARNYAPTIFSRHSDREGMTKPALEQAMYRLINNGVVVVEDYGRKGDQRKRLAPVQ